MNIGQCIHEQLKATAAITALVAGRIYQLQLPDNCPNPAIVYQKIDNPQDQAKAMGTTVGPQEPRYQVACWADTLVGAQALAAAVVTALQDFSGLFGGSGGITVTWIDYDGDTELADPDTGTFQVVPAFTIYFTL